MPATISTSDLDPAVVTAFIAPPTVKPASAARRPFAATLYSLWTRLLPTIVIGREAAGVPERAYRRAALLAARRGQSAKAKRLRESAEALRGAV